MLDSAAGGASYGFSGGGVDAYVEVFAAPKGVVEYVGVSRIVVGSGDGGCGGGDIVRGGCHCLRRDEEEGLESARGQAVDLHGLVPHGDYP